MAGKIEKKVFWMPYTQQGVSGGSGWILRTPPLFSTFAFRIRV
jgi:hypothetical protein